MPMFPYDPALTAAVQTSPQTIADVQQTMQTIEAICVDADGLKWFNWLYLQVTLAVETRITAGGFNDPIWLAELDVQFARLYFNALKSDLQAGPLPACWSALFDRRANTRIARIQFALAGINAHINHDLPEAIVATCQATGTAPMLSTPQHQDYTALNGTLDQLVEAAKVTLHVRLLGDPLPLASQLEDIIAAWGVSAARRQSWKNSELLWHLLGVPDLADGFMDSLDGLATVVSKTLLVAVP
jgi:hypothetical protein